MRRLHVKFGRMAPIGAAWAAVAAALAVASTYGAIAPATHAQPLPAKVFAYLPLVLRAAGRDDLPRPATARPATAVPTATATAILLTNVPPSVTPSPAATATATRGALSTEPPSATPLPSATVTPMPTSDGRVCRELTTNGDFEKGPAEWELESGFSARTLSQIIRKAAPNTAPRPTSGQYFANLGGGEAGVVEFITHPGRPLRLWSAIQSTRLVSASLSFDFTMLTNETPNRRADDTLQPVFVNQDGGEDPVSGAVLSEETVPPGTGEWKHFSYDVSRYVVVRPGWERLQLRIKSTMSENVPTWHYIDRISIEVCEKPAAAAVAGSWSILRPPGMSPFTPARSAPSPFNR